MQRTACPGATSSSGGIASSQRGSTYAQRAANEQPAGQSPTPTVTPGMPRSARGSPEVRDRGDERARVRVAGPLDDLVRRGVLDDPPRVHHDDPVGHPRDDGEIVRDVHHRHPLLVPQAQELAEDAVLGQHVEPGRRLVEHGDRGLAHARHRDRDALLLAARELVGVAPREPRIARRARRGRARRVTDSSDATPLRWARSTSMIESPIRSARVERAARVLRDVRDHAAAQAAQRTRIPPEDRLAAHRDGAAADHDARAACSRAARARSSSCRCRTRRRARRSRRRRTVKLTSSTTRSPVRRPSDRPSTRTTSGSAWMLTR